tara:strand:+ start:5481 stop:5888 length:408 start_codon:yes stop_codon:yes gene_type:complete
MTTNAPTDIKLHKKSATLELLYADGAHNTFSAEFLRVHSPSAEVRGHGKGQEILQTGKRQVKIVNLEPVGNYAIKLSFSDGHDTGIFSWNYLAELATDHDSLWDDYLMKLDAAKASREALPEGTQVINIMPSTQD